MAHPRSFPASRRLSGSERHWTASSPAYSPRVSPSTPVSAPHLRLPPFLHTHRCWRLPGKNPRFLLAVCRTTSLLPCHLAGIQRLLAPPTLATRTRVASSLTPLTPQAYSCHRPRPQCSPPSPSVHKWLRKAWFGFQFRCPREKPRANSHPSAPRCPDLETGMRARLWGGGRRAPQHTFTTTDDGCLRTPSRRPPAQDPPTVVSATPDSHDSR